MLIEFLETERTKEELNTALDIIKEFKEKESEREFMQFSCESWQRLEQLEEYLKLLINREKDTVEDTTAK